MHAYPNYLFLGTLPALGQDFGGATRIYTDFDGYWTSGTNDINPIMPDNTHHLLGFTWNGITYSTGIDDANLTAQGVNFSAQQYQAFPVRNIQAEVTLESASSQLYKIDLNQLPKGIYILKNSTFVRIIQKI